MEGLSSVAGGVTAVTGFEKGSGKTTFLNALLPVARKAGPVAVFSVGVDGASKARDGARAPEVFVEEGDVVLTTDLFARSSSARLEVLETLPGRSVLGRLLLGRAVRRGEVTLVGADHLAALARAVALVREEGWAASSLVDGAADRVTQLGALGDVGFVYTVRVDRGNLPRVAGRLRALVALSELPVVPEPPDGTLRLEGPLTEEVRQGLPEGLVALSLGDFTKVFLPPPELLRFLARVRCSVRRGTRLLGVVPALREMGPEELRQAVGPAVAALLLPNPCEVAA
ncbi:MAG TPA: hypothetical protein VE129_10625 [Thermoanaerobaculia bacterium]|nr:hypothetical protein [Thermoanaerobaculia bacterium]